MIKELSSHTCLNSLIIRNSDNRTKSDISEKINYHQHQNTLVASSTQMHEKQSAYSLTFKGCIAKLLLYFPFY